MKRASLASRSKGNFLQDIELSWIFIFDARLTEETIQLEKGNVIDLADEKVYQSQVTSKEAAISENDAMDVEDAAVSKHKAHVGLAVYALSVVCSF